MKATALINKTFAVLVLATTKEFTHGSKANR